ncbi:MAG: potassium channel family protein [Fusobacteriaceae bacterium]
MITQLKKFINSLLGFFLVFIIGVSGFFWIEEYSLLNSFYMTSITLGTVGFSEVVPLSDSGKIFTSILIFAGLTVYIYSISTLTSLIIEGELKKYFKDVKMNNKINKLQNHFIIVGYGRTGERIVENFRNSNLEFLIIEKNPEVIEMLKKKYTNPPLYILGDATEDSVLINAGIERSGTLIPVLSDDTGNLFITMSGKLLNPKIKVITRINDYSNYEKLKKVGATKILSSFDVTGDRIYSMAIESNLLSFQDMVDTYKNAKDLNLARILITEKSKFTNNALSYAELPKKIGIIVIGIERDEELLINPKASTVLNLKDRLLVMGTMDQIKKLEDLC